MKNQYRINIWFLWLLFVSAVPLAHAGVGLMLEQPYGKFGVLSPTGHAAIYLSRVCAASPVELRRCRADEAGVVISRYAGVGKLDWVAMPLLPYLYAVEQPDQVPVSLNAALAMRMRDQYRRAQLEGLVPDAADGARPDGGWNELVGNAYLRKIYIFEIETSMAQDDRLIAMLNGHVNRRQFNFFFANCANFAEGILNFYYPHSVHRSFTADVGLVTPKQLAKSFTSYAEQHKELQFSIFEIPQIPGAMRRSSNVCGVLEAVVRQKQYMVPLAILHPYFTIAMAGVYLTRGRFRPERNAIALNSRNEVEALLQNAPPARFEVQANKAEKAEMERPDAELKAGCRDNVCGRDDAGNTWAHNVTKVVTLVLEP